MKLFTLTKNGKLVRREYDADQYTRIRIEASRYCLWLCRETEKNYGGSHISETATDIIRYISDDDIVVYDGHFAGITAVADYAEHNGHGDVTEQGRCCILTKQAAAFHPEADAKAIRTGTFYGDDDHVRWDETRLKLLPFSLKNAILNEDEFSGTVLIADPALIEIVYHLMKKYGKEEVSYEHAKKMCSTDGITALVVLVEGRAVAYAAFYTTDWAHPTGIECCGIEENLGISNEEFFGLLS